MTCNPLAGGGRATAAAATWAQGAGPSRPEHHVASRQRLGKLKALVGPMLGRASESSDRPRTLETARSFLELVGKSANAWEAIKPWVNHTQRLDLLAQVCRRCCCWACAPDAWGCC